MDQVIRIMFCTCFLLQASHAEGVKPMAAAQVRDYGKYRYMDPLFSYIFEMLKFFGRCMIGR